MNIFEVSNQGLLLGVIAAFGGCTIRYGELYKRGKLNIKFYLVDAVSAVFIGAFMYAYLVKDLGISVIHASLFNILIGNLGSKAITLVCNIVKSQLGSQASSNTRK